MVRRKGSFGFLGAAVCVAYATEPVWIADAPVPALALGEAI
jgi:hypothetical protein